MAMAGDAPQESLLAKSSLRKKQTAQKCENGFVFLHRRVGKVRQQCPDLEEKPLKKVFFPAALIPL
jgi:hypothetical protein